MARDTMGQVIKARLDAMEALDDRTFRIRLNKPFPKMLFALGKSNAPLALIMPERIAKTDPFKLITEYVGSGPMKFNDRRMGAGRKAVFDKFGGYAVRPEAGGLAVRRQADDVRPHRVEDPARRADRRRRCRTARSTGGRRRCPTWCRC